MLPDPSKQTSCKECIFAKYENNTQVGCLADRISKFDNDIIAAYDEHTEFYVINRLCNMFRKHTWNDGIKDTSKARSEIRVTVDLIICCDNISEEYKNNIIDELNKIKKYHSKYSCYLYYSHNSTTLEKQRTFDIYNQFPENCFVSMYFNEIEYINNIIFKTKNSFHIKINDKNIYDISSFVIHMDKLINDDLKKMVLYKKDDKLAISNMACKILYNNLYLDYSENIVKLESDAKSNNLYIEV